MVIDIYGIKNKINGKIYVGQSVDVDSNITGGPVIYENRNRKLSELHKE